MDEEFEAFDGLNSGAWLLMDEGSGHRFGVIRAFGPSDQTGTVRLTFVGKRVQWDAVEYGDITVELPEQQARQLAERLYVEAVKLEHLRTLKRLGQLNYGNDREDR